MCNTTHPLDTCNDVTPDNATMGKLRRSRNTRIWVTADCQEDSSKAERIMHARELPTHRPETLAITHFYCRRQTIHGRLSHYHSRGRRNSVIQGTFRPIPLSHSIHHTQAPVVLLATATTATTATTPNNDGGSGRNDSNNRTTTVTVIMSELKLEPNPTLLPSLITVVSSHRIFRLFFWCL